MMPLPRSALTGLAAARMPIILAALVTTAAILTGGESLQPANLVNISRQISFEGLIALGMTLIIISGGIDLSVGSLVALTGVLAALSMRSAGDGPAVVALGVAAAVGSGAAVGALSGGIIARFAVPPFIVTLSVMLMARGFAFIACAGEPVYQVPALLGWLGRGYVAPGLIGNALPVPVLVLAGAYMAALVLLNRTAFGRCVVAIGGNEEAARLAGIPVGRTKLLVYLLTGALCGLAGVLNLGKLMSGDPKVGEMWELNVIAAVVVGGTSLFGGRGTMTGTLVGALIIGVLNNALNLLNVQHFWQKVALGGVILTAALIDVALRRLERR